MEQNREKEEKEPPERKASGTTLPGIASLPFLDDVAPKTQFCRLCQNPIVDFASLVIHNGDPLHSSCFEASFHIPYAVAHTVPQALIPSEQNQLMSSPVALTMYREPTAYQIAHYNIFPAPIVQFETSTLRPKEPIRASLVEVGRNITVDRGLAAGDVQAVLPGIRTVEFSGMKLSRVSHIKDALAPYQLDMYKCLFAINFSFGSSSLRSTTFHIVPSYASLPQEYQAARPYRRGANNPKKATKSDDPPTTTTTTTSKRDKEEEDEDKQNHKPSKKGKT